jgi:two-component system sensor histidine kinase TctE
MTSGLQRRLVVLLLLPLLVLALVNAWIDYRSADSAAVQLDRQLAAFLPLLADSIVAPGAAAEEPPVLLLAPPVDEFLHKSEGLSVYAVCDASGNVLHGSVWLAGHAPSTDQAEFHSEEYAGVVYRVAAQRVQTPAGELVVILGDGSDPSQQWVRSVLYRVLLPNLVLIALAAFAVNWAVRHALRPLLALRDEVEHRSPRDLSALDVQASPDEVRPLVLSLNRLFGLVNAQAESQRRFVADAAHQLRTPLAGLQAQVEAWAQAAHAANTGSVLLPAEQINKLRSATRRTSQLANQLLALSRANVRTLHAQPLHRVDLKAVCEALLEMHLDAATAKQIDLGLDVQPAHLMAQEWLLRELMGNLVDNAVKYTPAGGTVTLRCGVREGGAVFLEVEDDGPGIASAERGRVLERFYRTPGTEGEGNGLGLAIADEIAHSHGSHLSLESGGGGRGLRVTLVFPQ